MCVVCVLHSQASWFSIVRLASRTMGLCLLCLRVRSPHPDPKSSNTQNIAFIRTFSRKFHKLIAASLRYESGTSRNSSEIFVEIKFLFGWALFGGSSSLGTLFETFSDFGPKGPNDPCKLSKISQH